MIMYAGQHTQQTNICYNQFAPAFDEMMFHNFIIQTSCVSTGCINEENFVWRGKNLAREKVENQDACAELSFSTEGALFWSYQPSTQLCWAKQSNFNAGKIAIRGVVSGNNECVREGKSRGPKGLQQEVGAWMAP